MVRTNQAFKNLKIKRDRICVILFAIDILACVVGADVIYRLVIRSKHVDLISETKRYLLKLIHLNTHG